MNSPVNGILIATLITATASVAFAESSAQDSDAQDSQAWGSREAPPRDESEFWIPSLAITSGFLLEGAKASVVSTMRLTENGGLGELGDTTSGDDTFIGPLVNGSLELMTPAWGDDWGRPRLFAHAGIGGNFAFELDVAEEGAVDSMEIPDLIGPIPIDNDDVVIGQGSVTRAQPGGLLVSAGGGIAFSIDAWGRRIRIKPSAEYLREEVEVSGVVQRATVKDQGSSDPRVPPDFNLLTLSGSDNHVFHSIGPGLEVEADVARAGSLVMAVLVSGRAFRILGDRTVQFSGTGQLAEFGGAPETQSATWSYTKDPWSYQFHVGVRFRWVSPL